MFKSDCMRIAALCEVSSAEHSSHRACCELVSRIISRYGKTLAVNHVCIQQQASWQQNDRERASIDAWVFHEPLSHEQTAMHSSYFTWFWIFAEWLYTAIATFLYTWFEIYSIFWTFTFFDKTARHFWAHTPHSFGKFANHPQMRGFHFSNTFFQGNAAFSTQCGLFLG